MTDHGQAGLRARRQARTRAAIVTAALDLFVQRGYDAVTVTDIAARADIGRTTFFRYFADKSDVLFADGPELTAVLLGAAAEAAAADLAALGGQVRGTVRAVGLQSAARRLLVPAVARTAVEHPQVRVEVSELELEQALPGLRLGAVDLAVSDEYDGHPRPRPAGLRFAPLHEEPLLLVLPAAHPLARGGGPVPLVALRGEVWAASAEGTGHHAMVVGTCRALGGYEPDVRHRAGDAEIQLELVRTTGAVALLPALTLPAADPAVAIREVAGAVVGRRLVAVTRDGHPAPALTAFLAAVTDRVRALGSASPARGAPER